MHALHAHTDAGIPKLTTQHTRHHHQHTHTHTRARARARKLSTFSTNTKQNMTKKLCNRQSERHEVLNKCVKRSFVLTFMSDSVINTKQTFKSFPRSLYKIHVPYTTNTVRYGQTWDRFYRPPFFKGTSRLKRGFVQQTDEMKWKLKTKDLA